VTRFDVLFFEEAALDRHEIGERGRGREHANLHLVLRGGRLAQGSDNGSDDGDDRPQRLQPDRLHSITSILRWRSKVPAALAVAGAGGPIHNEEGAASVTNFSVMGLFVAWGLVQIGGRCRLVDCNGSKRAVRHPVP